MSEKIKSFFELKMTSGNGNDSQALELATAALLIEMIHMDDEVSKSEQQAVFQSIQSHFKLDKNQTEELCQLAESELKHTTDYSRFTSLINEHFAYTDKLTIIELLWRIAYADKQLHRDEAYFAREIGKLLEVSQDDFDACRNKVRQEVLT